MVKLAIVCITLIKSCGNVYNRYFSKIGNIGNTGSSINNGNDKNNNTIGIIVNICNIWNIFNIVNIVFCLQLCCDGQIDNGSFGNVCCVDIIDDIGNMVMFLMRIMMVM